MQVFTAATFKLIQLLAQLIQTVLGKLQIRTQTLTLLTCLTDLLGRLLAIQVQLLLLLFQLLQQRLLLTHLLHRILECLRQLLIITCVRRQLQTAQVQLELIQAGISVRLQLRVQVRTLQQFGTDHLADTMLPAGLLFLQKSPQTARFWFTLALQGFVLLLGVLQVFALDRNLL